MNVSPLALAKHIAAKFHEGQMYGEHPYFTHLVAVAENVKRMNPNDERLEVVAYLHDILEDTDCTETILAALFDSDVVSAVVALTKTEDMTREYYLIEVARHSLALQVKMADTFCNLRESLYRGDVKRIKKYGEQMAVLASKLRS